MPLDDPAATAEGDFRRTPLPHLLVYMADRRLSGALFLKEPQGLEHVVRFECGSPVRVMPGDGFALFGEMLVEAGIVREEVVRGALATKGLLGDVLILTGHAEADELESVASEQLLRRMVRLFALPPDTTYRYFENHDALAATTPGCRVDVLRLLLEGLRSHPRAGLSLSKLMERLGELPLRMHPDALLDRFGWSDAEAAVIQAIVDDRPTLVDLLSAGAVEASVVRCVVYTLLLTRQIDVGQKTMPLGHEETAPVVTVGRVALASAVHRLGAAAPDPAGDGERAAVMPRRLRRRKSRPEPIANVPIVAGDGEDEPVSDVIEICAPTDATSAEESRIKGDLAAISNDGEAAPSEIEDPTTGERPIVFSASGGGTSLPPAVSAVRFVPRTRKDAEDAGASSPGSGRRPTPVNLAGIDEDFEQEPVSDVMETAGPASVRKRDATGGSRGS